MIAIAQVFNCETCRTKPGKSSTSSSQLTTSRNRMNGEVKQTSQSHSAKQLSICPIGCSPRAAQLLGTKIRIRRASAVPDSMDGETYHSSPRPRQAADSNTPPPPAGALGPLLGVQISPSAEANSGPEFRYTDFDHRRSVYQIHSPE